MLLAKGLPWRHQEQKSTFLTKNTYISNVLWWVLSPRYYTLDHYGMLPVRGYCDSPPAPHPLHRYTPTHLFKLEPRSNIHPFPERFIYLQWNIREMVAGRARHARVKTWSFPLESLVNARWQRGDTCPPNGNTVDMLQVDRSGHSLQGSRLPLGRLSPIWTKSEPSFWPCLAFNLVPARIAAEFLIGMLQDPYCSHGVTVLSVLWRLPGCEG